MGNRKSLTASRYVEIDPIPSPNRQIPTISVDFRLFYPSNAAKYDIANALSDAYWDLRGKLDLAFAQESVRLCALEGICDQPQVASGMYALCKDHLAEYHEWRLQRGTGYD